MSAWKTSPRSRERLSRTACLRPSAVALNAIALELMDQHPSWTFTRCAQRAVVEWFKRGSPC